MSDGEPFEIKKIEKNEEPRRFVRTLESDAAALKQGSAPGFTEASSPSETAPVQSQETTPPPPPAPPPPPPPPKAEPTIEARARLVEGSSFATYTPINDEEPRAKPPPPPTPPPQAKAPIRTYTSDFAQRIRTTDSSTAAVLAAEGDAGGARSASPPQSSYNVPLIVGGLLLFALGLGGAYATYQYLGAPEPIQIIEGAPTPIFVNERSEVRGEGAALMNAVSASLRDAPTSGSVRLLTLTSSSTDTSVFHALELPAPAVLLRNVRGIGSIAGIVNTGSAASPFFILSVESYGDTFAGMLAWEPRLQRDLAELYPTSATTTRAFRDEVIGNHDIRIARDATGKSIVLYGYFDETVLIITREEGSFAELIKRLTTSRTAR